MGTAKYKGFVNGFWLKIIMVVFMILDHVYFYFPSPTWFTILGRLVAPTFVFLMTEGLVHTRSQSRYIRRLLLFGLGMLLVNIIIMLFTDIFIPMNIFLSLAVSAGIIATIEGLRKEVTPQRVISLLLLIASVALVEGAFLGPVLAIVFYYLRDNKIVMSITYILASVAICIAFRILYHQTSFIQFWMIGAIVPILLYNGERGPSNKFSQYFFYVIYPLHIYILCFLHEILSHPYAVIQ